MQKHSTSQAQTPRAQTPKAWAPRGGVPPRGSDPRGTDPRGTDLAWHWYILASSSSSSSRGTDLSWHWYILIKALVYMDSINKRVGHELHIAYSPHFYTRYKTSPFLYNLYYIYKTPLIRKNNPPTQLTPRLPTLTPTTTLYTMCRGNLTSKLPLYILTPQPPVISRDFMHKYRNSVQGTSTREWKP